MTDKTDNPVAWGMFREDRYILDVITPEEHAVHEGEYTVPMFTADQLAAAVAAERERCAKVCENFAASIKDYCERTYTNNDGTAQDCADKIREGA